MTAFDFGPLKISGAFAVRSPLPGRVIIYEVVRGGGMRLGQSSGTAAGQKLDKSWLLLTRQRKVPLRFPDITQEGDAIRFGPPEMATAVGYQLELR